MERNLSLELWGEMALIRTQVPFSFNSAFCGHLGHVGPIWSERKDLGSIKE